MWFTLPLQIKKSVLQENRGYTIVEFGVFSSYNHPPLIEDAITNGDEYIGITHSADQFTKLTKKYEDHDNITIMFMSHPKLFAVELSDESVDLVVFSNTFHEFINEKSLLTEVDRILKPGANLAVVEFTTLTPERIVHFSNHNSVSKYARTVLPLEPSFGVSAEVYQKSNVRSAI